MVLPPPPPPIVQGTRKLGLFLKRVIIANSFGTSNGVAKYVRRLTGGGGGGEQVFANNKTTTINNF